ncbi:hypothetical protein AR1Y2_1420 [Anaerostipes rhamnosivorans]|uniref:Uncharacterized protein n=1 Tax=Anaerostipes rhamnosivorans TaxID=1229621 RepID=A0A4P8IGC8_9FIRM|nr:hypothetical protein AR1Y2_1420 [Anaerostipes rhamnosivorans]
MGITKDKIEGDAIQAAPLFHVIGNSYGTSYDIKTLRENANKMRKEII